MRVVNTTKVIISVEELTKIVAEHLKKVAQVSNIRGDIVRITHEVRQEEIPGYDPHDCSYREVFAGITVTLEEK
jgi:hypothetical protein